MRGMKGLLRVGKSVESLGQGGKKNVNLAIVSTVVPNPHGVIRRLLCDGLCAAAPGVLGAVHDEGREREAQETDALHGYEKGQALQRAPHVGQKGVLKEGATGDCLAAHAKGATAQTLRHPMSIAPRASARCSWGETCRQRERGSAEPPRGAAQRSWQLGR